MKLCTWYSLSFTTILYCDRLFCFPPGCAHGLFLPFYPERVLKVLDIKLRTGSVKSRSLVKALYLTTARASSMINRASVVFVAWMWLNSGGIIAL